jgi:hypothetical protein
MNNATLGLTQQGNGPNIVCEGDLSEVALSIVAFAPVRSSFSLRTPVCTTEGLRRGTGKSFSSIGSPLSGESIGR